MNQMVQIILLALACNIDTFMTAWIYGIERISLQKKVAVMIALTTSIIFTISTFFGLFLTNLIAPDQLKILCFLFLLFLGISKLLSHFMKKIVQRYENKSKSKAWNLSSFRFILTVYIDPEKADIDHSHTLSMKEAISTATVLSMDGVAVGTAVGFIALDPIACFFTSFLVAFFLFGLGFLVGAYLQTKLKWDISWLGGLLLIMIALFKYFV